MLDESGQPFSCLIEGRFDYGMTLAAPYIMRLKKDVEFTRTLIQQAWGNDWGIFVTTYKQTTLIKVRDHCKAGPISEFIFEKNQDNDKPTDMSIPFYRYAQIEKDVVDLNAIPNEDELRRIQNNPYQKIEGKLSITSQHMGEFEKHRRTFFFKQMLHHLQTTFKLDFSELGDTTQQFQWAQDVLSAHYQPTTKAMQLETASIE